MFHYTIQYGDTLNEIAHRFDVSVEELMNFNPGVDPYNLWVGQVIRIPAARGRRYPEQPSHPIYPAHPMYQPYQPYPPRTPGGPERR